MNVVILGKFVLLAVALRQMSFATASTEVILRSIPKSLGTHRCRLQLLMNDRRIKSAHYQLHPNTLSPRYIRYDCWHMDICKLKINYSAHPKYVFDFLFTGIIEYSHLNHQMPAYRERLLDYMSSSCLHYSSNIDCSTCRLPGSRQCNSETTI